MKIKHYILFPILTIFILLFSGYIAKLRRYRLIPFENKDLGLVGKVKVIDVKNKNIKNGLHGFIMHAGGAKASDYIKFAKKLDIENVRLIDHNNLEPTTNKKNYPKRIYRKIFKLANKTLLIDHSHNQPTLFRGSPLFWEAHNKYISVAIEDYNKHLKKKNQSRYIFIGHSHGASFRAGDYISEISTNEPIKVFLMPCLDPDKKSNKYKILTIIAENDNDQCAIDSYNKDLIAGRFTYELKNADHFSFLSNKKDQKKVISLINKFIKNNH